MAKRPNPRTNARYRRARRAFLAAQPYCVACRAKGVTMPSAELDHVVPLADGGPLWDEANWQALCESCHDVKSANENAVRHVDEIPGRAAWRDRVGRLSENVLGIPRCHKAQCADGAADPRTYCCTG